MRNGMFIFDNVCHMYDNTSANVVDKTLADRRITTGLTGAAHFMTMFGEQYDFDESFADGQLDIDDAIRMLFEESDTDMVMAQAVPISGYWKDGYFPIARNHALAQAAPDRVLFCGGVDPNGMSHGAVLREMERQVVELGAKSFKFYQAGPDGETWAADDRDFAYPIWEKAVELGVPCVQFHKGQPFGQQILGPAFGPLDLQKPARDFPELNFIIHHLGDPYITETINVASRFPNVSLALTGFLNAWPISPMDSLHILGKCLRYVGEDRLLYGSESFIFPSIQSYIELLDGLEMPEELQDRWGYPDITRQTKEKLFGLNFARIMGIDLAARKKELGLADGSADD